MRAALWRRGGHALTVLLIALCEAAACPGAGALELLVQPPPWAGDRPALVPEPFAALLARALGTPVRARVSDDTLSHWHAVRGPADYQLAFDEAHFADYRIRRRGFSALVRDPADARFAVVVRPRTLVTGPADLVARAVAVPEPPSLGVERFLALFPRALRTPRLIVLATPAAALDALDRGDVAGVLLAVGDDAQVAGAQVALVTDVSPGRVLTVAPSIAAPARAVLIQSLLAAAGTPEGRRALAGMGVRALVATSNEHYEGNERLLRGTWGYR